MLPISVHQVPIHFGTSRSRVLLLSSIISFLCVIIFVSCYNSGTVSAVHLPHGFIPSHSLQCLLSRPSKLFQDHRPGTANLAKASIRLERKSGMIFGDIRNSRRICLILSFHFSSTDHVLLASVHSHLAPFEVRSFASLRSPISITEMF